MRKMNDEDVEIIARVMHEAVLAFSSAHSQSPIPHWNRAPKWMKQASKEGVLFRIEYPDAPASAQHDQWTQLKINDGWKFGKKKDGNKKTHPLLIPYDKLPFIERQKDALVAGIIDALLQDL